MEKASKAVHDARAAHQKKLRKFELDKSVRSDDIRKARAKMEEVVKKGQEEVKRVHDGAKRVLEG
jgi:ribosome recycling factor